MTLDQTIQKALDDLPEQSDRGEIENESEEFEEYEVSKERIRSVNNLVFDFLLKKNKKDPVELVIYRIARIALLEAHDAACSARRSVGQLLRTDR